VLLRHVALAAADPLRTLQLQEAVAAAARAAAARAPEAALLQARAPQPAGPSLRRAGHFAGVTGAARGARRRSAGSTRAWRRPCASFFPSPHDAQHRGRVRHAATAGCHRITCDQGGD